uniref:Uncharacterized protein n=1 Tax=Caenorhabditis japonica TaxID=281687 RepID=A0A8R1DPA3_CAEJA
MTDARAALCYLNGLSLQTINEVEKILRGLPQKGTRCEVQMSKPLTTDCERGTGDVIASKSLKIRDEPRPLTLSPTRKIKSQKETKNNDFGSRVYTPQSSSKEIRYCQLLTDQVRVSPILSCRGVILEVDVLVTIPGGNETKKLKLDIECPDFKPSRIKIGEKWKNIV